MINNETLYPSDILTIINTLYAQSLTESHIYKTKVVVPAASVETWNATPVLLVAAPGAGYAIRVLRVSGNCNGAGAWATNTQVAIYTTQANPQFKSIAAFLEDGGGAVHQSFLQNASLSAEESDINENAALYSYVLNGNPTDGPSEVTLYISYEIVTL